MGAGTRPRAIGAVMEMSCTVVGRVDGGALQDPSAYVRNLSAVLLARNVL